MPTSKSEADFYSLRAPARAVNQLARASSELETFVVRESVNPV